MWKPIILDVECIVCNKTLHKINHDPREITRNMGKIANNSTRRSRTPNWSLAEKQYLLRLISDRKEVVVTLNNNGPNHSEEKDVAWNEILRELALKFGNKFVEISIKKVKTQWQNMKRIAREEIAVHGAAVEKYSRQSFEVCQVLDLVKDGVLKSENVPINDSTSNITTNVEIKAERIDEDVTQPTASTSVVEEPMETTPSQENVSKETTQLESSSSEQPSEVNEYDTLDETRSPEQQFRGFKKNASIMTETSLFETSTINPFHSELQEFFRFSSSEKRLKMDTLKEERQIVRAMRETAELNKIIAEQKLKHMLWVKKREMAMYSGEPGSGAGKGGGGGGAIREAGGAFGKMEAAREDEFFYKKQKEQLQNLKVHLSKEISFHQEQIKHHEDAIQRHKKQLADTDSKK